MAKIGCKVVDAFEQQKFCDVSLLLADGSKIGAHRTVLQIGSQWFQTRLSKEWDHSETSIQLTLPIFLCILQNPL